MTQRARKAAYTGPEVRDGTDFDDQVDLYWEGGRTICIVNKSDIPDLIARLRKFAPPEPKSEQEYWAHATFVPQPFAAERAIAIAALKEAEAETRRGYKPKRKAKAKPDDELPDGFITHPTSTDDLWANTALLARTPRRKAKAKRGGKHG